ncbi:ABC transporter permease [Nocardioides sp. NPDC023903]|uniref:ABC transporter permease n=1 Tax=Nocardioides sp. NPDC023903 TaxID=3157195 RepID=UPI0033C86137
MFSPTTLLILPALAIMLIFFVVPAITILSRAWTDYQAPQVGGWDNFTWFFTNTVNIRILVRTFAVSLLVTAICLIMAFPFAYLMTLVSRRWLVVMMTAVLLPFFTNYLVRIFAWVVLLQDNGLVNKLAGVFGIGPFEIIGSTFAVAIGMAQTLLPLMILPLYSVLQGIDRNLLRASESLGASPLKSFTRIYLPLALPGMLAGSVLVFVFGLGFYLTPAVLGSPQNSMLAQQVVTQVQDLLAWGRGAVMGMVLVVVTLLLLAVAMRFARGAVSAAYGIR